MPAVERRLRVVEVAAAEGAGGDPHQLAEERGRGAPHGVADELEERDGLDPAAGEGPHLFPEQIGVGELPQGQVEHRLDLGGAGPGGGPAITPRNGAMNVPLEMVARWSSSPTTSMVAGSRPISSCASRSAPSTGDSPGSTRPPGKLTSPWWVRRPQVRRVSTTHARPSSPSYSGTSTADGRSGPRTGPSISSRSEGRGGPCPASAARTSATEGRRAPGARWAQGGGPPARAL